MTTPNLHRQYRRAASFWGGTGLILALALTLLTATLPSPAQAETYNPFIEFACYPEADAFTIRQMVHHGQQSNTPDDFEEKHGFVNYDDAKGSCTLGDDTIKWTYRYNKHNPLGQCGTVFWGGFISITVNDQPFLEDVGFGGLLGLCPGSALQYVEVSHDRPGNITLLLDGYWGAKEYEQKAIRPKWPLTGRTLSEYFPNCNVGPRLPRDNPTCNTLQRFYIGKAYNKDWFEIDGVANIWRPGQ